AVLHLEPDVRVVLADLAIELGIERSDRVTGDLPVAEEQLLRFVVERPLVRCADVRPRHPAPPTRVDGQRIRAPDAGHEMTRTDCRLVWRATVAGAPGCRRLPCVPSTGSGDGTLSLRAHRRQRHACDDENARRDEQTHSHCGLLLPDDAREGKYCTFARRHPPAHPGARPFRLRREPVLRTPTD